MANGDGLGLDGFQFSEEANTNIEQFNENVRAAGFGAGQKVAAATKKSGGKTAQGFAAAGGIIVQQLNAQAGHGSSFRGQDN